MRVLQCFFDLGESIYPDQARAMVAELMNGIQPALVATLMNYIPGTSTSKTEFPPVQFGRYQGGFCLLGFGEAGSCIVNDAAPLIHAALCRHKPEQIIKSRSRELSLAVEPRPYALRYTVPRMVVQKKEKHAARLLTDEAGKRHIESLFLGSIQRQADAVGVLLPPNLEIAFMGAKGTFAAKQNPGSQVAHLGLKGAVFDVHAWFSGIWTAGYMLSKGNGHFDATYQLSGAFNALPE